MRLGPCAWTSSGGRLWQGEADYAPDQGLRLRGADGGWRVRDRNGREQRREPRTGSDQLCRLWRSNRSRLSKGGDAVVRPGDIDRALREPCFRAEDALFIAILRIAFYRELSLADLQSVAEPTDSHIQRLVTSLQAELDDMQRTLYAHPDPLESIRLDALRPRRLAHSSFLAALGAVVASRPWLVMSSIESVGDAFLVTFPGFADHPVLVDQPTDAEVLVYAGVGRYGWWPAVLVKAFDTLLEEIQPEDCIEAGFKAWCRGPVAWDRPQSCQAATQLDRWTSVLRPNTPLRPMVAIPRHWCHDDAAPDAHSDFLATVAFSVLTFDPSTDLVEVRHPAGCRPHATEEPDLESSDHCTYLGDGRYRLSRELYNRAFSHSLMEVRSGFLHGLPEA